MIEGTGSALCVTDDILVFGVTQMGHDTRIEIQLSTTKEKTEASPNAHPIAKYGEDLRYPTPYQELNYQIRNVYNLCIKRLMWHK